MGFWLLENNYPVSVHNHQELVSGFRAQGFTRFARDHDLVLAERVASGIALHYGRK